MKKKMIFVLAAVVCVLAIVFVCQLWLQHRMQNDTGKKPKATKEPGMVQADFQVEQVRHTKTDIYTEDYQKEVDEQLSAWKGKNTYGTDNPLMVWNPYGTNTGSFYYYAQTDKACYAVCQITPDKGSVVKHRLVNDGSGKVTKEHEYLLTGLATGRTNEIQMSFYDEKDKLLVSKSYTVKLNSDKEVPKILKVEKGESKQALTDGLFAVMGHDKSKAVNIYYYDNDGVSRGKTPLNDYRTDRILTIDGKLVFSYSLTDLAVVNRLGRVEQTINLGKYELHHDFMYDKGKNTLLCLVNDTDKDTIEDVLISVDYATGKVRELVDFEVLMKESRQKHVQRKGGKNTYGGTELDWLHLNSLDLINENDGIFSSREESVLIKVKDIYTNPKIDYLIHSGSLYKGTGLEKYLLKQKGDFVGHAGQHTITVEKDPSLPEGQYYLYMYNNNFGSAKTLPDFDWSLYPGVGTYRKGTASYFCKYLVDEKKKTYEMVQQFAVPYSSVVSGVNYIGNNITFSSGMDHTYGEYDKDGKMICTYTYKASRYAYRVIKYDFTGVYYEKEQ